MHLSNIFKFTEGLRQDGHQIGRKVGDALELLTFGMIEKDSTLIEPLVIENGIEGATSAEHKVEFSFYQKGGNGFPSKNPDELFGLVECKKVGVEQTINSTFKKWRTQNPVFYSTVGYNFLINPATGNYKWDLTLSPLTGENNLRCAIKKKDVVGKVVESTNQEYKLNAQERILIVVDIDGNLYVKGVDEYLSSINSDIQTCKIVRATLLESNKIKELIIEDALSGPQTPEKAKQASFVSLDVRKRVLGHFDKLDEDMDKFVSILVIGEASHWEEKSRSMVRLCNDYNLLVPDNAIVLLFEKFKEAFGDSYQDKITKSLYQSNGDVKRLTTEVIDEFDEHILKDMATGHWVKFSCHVADGKSKLQVVDIE